MAFTHSVCLARLLTSLFSVKLYLAPSLILLSALPLELRMNDVSFTIFVCACERVCFCVCVMSPAWPCLSEAEPCCQCLCMCIFACEKERWGDEVVKPPHPPLPPTLTSQNETLNTSQSVKLASKIETDPLFSLLRNQIDTFDNMWY